MTGSAGGSGSTGALSRTGAAGRTASGSAAAPGRVLSASLLLRPTATANAFEETVHRLVQSLRLGLVAPGEKLPPERELAGMLGVSRDTVREAIGALVASGYLVARRGRYGGTFVVDPLPGADATVCADWVVPAEETRILGLTPELSPEALADTLALRGVLEVGTARRLARTDLAGCDRERLWRAGEACTASRPEDYRIGDAQLHLLLGELVDAPSLVPMLAEIRLRVNAYLDRIPLLTPNLEHSDEQHRRIIGAVLAGRADEAAAAMEEHLEGTEQLLRGFLA